MKFRIVRPKGAYHWYVQRRFGVFNFYVRRYLYMDTFFPSRDWFSSFGEAEQYIVKRLEKSSRGRITSAWYGT